MRDKLSFLLRFNEKSERCESTSEVLRTWKPMFEALSKKKGVSESALLSSLLFKGFVAEREWVHLDSGEDSDEKQDSGKLDKLNDDVLGHCVSFLGHGDVLNSVEHVCRRLFHVSRSLKKPFDCDKFDEVFEKRPEALCIMKAAERFNTSYLNMSTLRRMNRFPVRELAAKFVDSAKHLTFDSETTQVSAVKFKKLGTVQTKGVDSATVKAFVARNPTVSHWVVGATVGNSVLNAAFYAHLREMANIRSVTLSLFSDNPNDWSGENEPDPFSAQNSELLAAAPPMTRVTSVTLPQIRSLDLARAFLHSNLRKLTISAIFLSSGSQRPATYAPFALDSLETLKWNAFGRRSSVCLDQLQTEPSKLRLLSCESVVIEDMVAFVRKCPFGVVTMRLWNAVDLNRSEDIIASVTEELHSVNWQNIQPELVQITLGFAVNQWTLFQIQLIAKMTALISTGTRVCLKWWKEAGFNDDVYDAIVAGFRQTPHVTFSEAVIARRDPGGWGAGW